MKILSKQQNAMHLLLMAGGGGFRLRVVFGGPRRGVAAKRVSGSI